MTTESYVHLGPVQRLCPIVEFTGITGAGKTTLFHAVHQQLTDAGIKVIDAYDLILQAYRLQFVRNEKLKSVCVDALVLLPALRTILSPSGFGLFALACREIYHHAPSIAIAAYLLRNVIKRIGVHCSLQRIQQQAGRNLDYDFILCDEGILHIAHNLFVHSHNLPNLDQVTQFGAIVPKPDLVIWVVAAPEQSIQCILARGHDRVGQDQASAKSFVDHAYLMFNTLFQTTDLSGRFWKIDCSWSNIADQLAIYDRAASNMTHSLIKTLNDPC